MWAHLHNFLMAHQSKPLNVVPIDRDVVLLDFWDGHFVSGGKAAADFPEGPVLGLWEDNEYVDRTQRAHAHEHQEYVGLQCCLYM